MRKILAIIASVLLSGAAASAQLAVSGGWQANQLIRTNVADDGYRTYIYAWSQGAYAGVSSGGSLGAPGLGYSYSIMWNYTTGTEPDVLLIMDDPHYPGASKGQVITDEHYLSVPAALSYGFQIAPWMGLDFQLGAEVAYCLSSKSYSSWPGVDCINIWNVDHFDGATNYNRYRRFDLGLISGFGLVLFNRLKLEGGAGYGLLDRSGGDGLLHRFSVHAGLAYIFK